MKYKAFITGELSHDTAGCFGEMGKWHRTRDAFRYKGGHIPNGKIGELAIDAAITYSYPNLNTQREGKHDARQNPD